MKCKITHFEERENALKGTVYFVIKATGTQGDTNANAFDDDGVINFNAVQSRTFNFTKCLFPATDEQCEQLRNGFEVDDDGNVLNDRYIYLTLFQWETGKNFYIYGTDGARLSETQQQEVEKVASKDMTVNGKMVKKGQTYKVIEEVEVDRVFTRISLTLLCDKDGNSVENDGEAPESIAKRNFETGLANGVYELVEE